MYRYMWRKALVNSVAPPLWNRLQNTSLFPVISFVWHLKYTSYTVKKCKKKKKKL